MTRIAVDTIIRGGIVVTPSGRSASDIGIRDGRISHVIDRDSTTIELDAATVLDARGAFVLPGAIDAHVHFATTSPGAEPGFVDDFLRGTRAAIHGGVTTVGQMSFTDTGSLRAAVEADHAQARALSTIDYVLHPGTYAVAAEAISELAGLAEEGYRTLKLVTLALDEDSTHFAEAVARAGEHGMLTLLHCEDGALIEHATSELMSDGRSDLRFYPESRPVVTESAAVDRAIALCELTGSPIYIVHLSSARALEAVRAAKGRGLPVFAETRPIYLYLTDRVHAEPDGGRFIGMPPLRRDEDVRALWEGLADGSIDTVASDHAPWSLAAKIDPALTVETARKGMAELDTFLPLLYSEGVRTGRLSLERLVAVSAENPARLLGLYPQKGALQVGSDADIVVLDPADERTIRAAELESAADYSVYEGWTATGWPRLVLSRGEVVLARDGSSCTITAAPGRGRWLPAGERREPV